MEDNTTYPVVDEARKPDFEYATPGQRFANYLIDFVVGLFLYFVVLVLLAMVLQSVGKNLRETMALLHNRHFRFPIFFLVDIVTYTLFEGDTKGRTVGKLITGTQAVREQDLSPITWKDALIRSLIRLVPFEPFTAFAGSPLHDKWSKTCVITKRQER